jgi:hypothetical protein
MAPTRVFEICALARPIELPRIFWEIIVAKSKSSSFLSIVFKGCLHTSELIATATLQLGKLSNF